ncbi:NADAR domain-containing protein, partial [Dysosmobacter welbionis]
NVAQLQARRSRRTAVLHRVYEGTLADVIAVLLGHAAGQGADGGAQIGLVAHIAVGHDVLDHADDVIDGDSEAQALHTLAGAAVAGVFGGHDTHHLAVAVQQRTTGVAGVDGGIGLDHIEGRAVHVDGAVHAGDHAAAHGERQVPQGVANGQNPVAHIQLLTVAQGDGLQAGGLDLDDRDVVVLIPAHILGVVFIAVVQGDLHGLGILHHMVVGDNIAIRGENKAGAGGCRLYRLTEEVVAVGPGDIDRHHAVDIGGVNLRVAHRRLAVHGFQCDLTDGAAADVDRGLVAA